VHSADKQPFDREAPENFSLALDILLSHKLTKTSARADCEDIG